MVYKELEKRESEDLSVHISYLEIYQDVGYDLLNPGARTQSYVIPFPKVQFSKYHLCHMIKKCVFGNLLIIFCAFL